MIEKIVLDYMKDNLSVPVLMEQPQVPSDDFSTVPEQYIVIEKVAGDITDHIRSATFAIQSYSTISLYNAAALDELAQGVMDEMAAHVSEVSECSMTADTNFTDTSTKRYRYQCLYNIFYYGGTTL